MIETAVILAGGKGERMLPITEFQQKALVPVLGIPILKLQIDQLEKPTEHFARRLDWRH